MKYTVVALSCLLAVAYAQFGGGQYFPNNQDGNYFNRFNPNRNSNQYNPYNRNQQYQNPFSNNRFVSSTPFPKPTYFPSSTPAPLTAVTAADASPAPVVSYTPAPPPPPVPTYVASRYGSDARSAETVRYSNEINPDGSFAYAFETTNGIAAQAQGAPRNFGDVAPDVFQGGFSWTSPEGQPFTFTYVADENGYQPSGDAIPQPPPIPPQIARALEYIARNAPLVRNYPEQK